MSTVEEFILPEELNDFLTDITEDDLLATFGTDEGYYGPCPYISFYIYHDKSKALDITKKIIDIYEEFESFIDEPFQKKFKTSTQVWLGVNDSRLPKGLYEESGKAFDKEKDFWFGATELKNVTATPRWSIAGVANHDCYLSYTTLKLVFREKWYNQNKAKWHKFVARCISDLKPTHCYSGYEVNSGPLGILGNYEAETMERTLTDYFYGLDIDHHLTMAYQSHADCRKVVMPTNLGAGIRTPTWCFMLSPFWLNKLGKTEEQVRQALDDPRITITAFPYPKNDHNPEGINGLWIQLGELDLHPVGNGKPELLVTANELIKPIRCDQLKLTSLDAWDDDPNPRFDYFSGVNWMRRFDDDMDWLNHRCPNSPLPPGIYEAKPGQSVPAAGTWFAVNEPNLAERIMKLGEPLPVKPDTNEEGEPILWRCR